MGIELYVRNNVVADGEQEHMGASHRTYQSSIMAYLCYKLKTMGIDTWSHCLFHSSCTKFNRLEKGCKMTTCMKYKVIHLWDDMGPQQLQDWLNEQCEQGLDLVAVKDNRYIFARNAYIKSIKRAENDENLPL